LFIVQAFETQKHFYYGGSGRPTMNMRFTLQKTSARNPEGYILPDHKALQGG
jgi:hypothetical protein